MLSSKSRRRSMFAAVLLAGTALGGLGVSLAPATAQDTAITPPAVMAQPGPALPGFGALVSRVRPAVVTITSTKRVGAEAASSPFPPDSNDDQRFRRYFGENQPGPNGRPRANRDAPTAKGLGSGFLVDAEGHVVTNNHVIDGAGKVVVTLDDGRELEARVVGRDPRTDVALLKVETSEKLPFLALGDSDKAQPGDWVVAMGNPFGLGGSVTAGIVSARGRDIGAGPYDDFLQIDASINRGNSGGPLFGMDGTVVGVNTAIFSPSGGSVGIGFAIPANVVKQVVAELEANGRIERGFLGVSTQKIDPALATALKLPKAEGALVAEVQANGPAAAAGLKAGDVVTAVNGVAVRDPKALARQVAGLRPGSAVPLVIQRNGAEQTLRVTASALEDKTADAAAQPVQASGGRLGLALAPLDPAARESLGVKADINGAVIAAVRPGSPASEAGLKSGDVVMSVGNRLVATPEDAVVAIREQDGKQPSVALRVLRDGRSLFVAVRSA